MVTQDQAEHGALKAFGVMLAISAALVVPFMVLEGVNRRAYQDGFPLVLFSFMWLHALIIVLSLAPALRRLRAERRLRALGPGHWAGLLLGGFLVFVYVNVVIDQWLCFLGVPNCD